MDREQALNILKEQGLEENLIKHCLASEAIMRKLAQEYGEDVERWGLIGLLHDIDFSETKDKPQEHTLKAGEILRTYGFDEDFIAVIQSHNAEEIGGKREQKIEYALTAAETITGLIVATALVYPDKKLASVKPKSIRKRMKQKAFARAVNRDRIRECELMGMELNQFIEVSLEAMRGISDELGL